MMEISFEAMEIPCIVISFLLFRVRNDDKILQVKIVAINS